MKTGFSPKKILWILSAIAVLAAVLWWRQGLEIRVFLDNQRMGTFRQDLAPEKLKALRTMELEGVRFTVPPQWVVMRGYPQKDCVGFALRGVTLPNSVIVVNAVRVKPDFQGLEGDAGQLAISRALMSMKVFKPLLADNEHEKFEVNGFKWLRIRGGTVLNATEMFFSHAKGVFITVYAISVPAEIGEASRRTREFLGTFA